MIDAREDVIAGIPAGCQIRPPDYEMWDRWCVTELEVTDDECAHHTDWLLSKIGDQYDSAAIWGYLTGLPLHDPGHYICSAYQMDALSQIGKVLPAGDDTIPDSQVEPDELFLLITRVLGAKVIEKFNM